MRTSVVIIPVPAAWCRITDVGSISFTSRMTQ